MARGTLENPLPRRARRRIRTSGSTRSRRAVADVADEAPPAERDSQASDRRPRAPVRLAGRPRAPRMPQHRPARRRAPRHPRRVARRDPVARRRLELRHPAAGDALVLPRELGPDPRAGEVRRRGRGVPRGRVPASAPCRLLAPDGQARTADAPETAVPRLLALRPPRRPADARRLGGSRRSAHGRRARPPRVEALSEGTWRCEGTWWKRPGSKGGNVEAVDWGDAADELLTEQATRVLAAAGRL